MQRILVWDIPTRLFHWLLAAAFSAAFGIAVLVDDDAPAFAIHMLLGLVVALMVVLRVVWGLVGSRYARFGSFALSPKALLEYLGGALTGGGKRYVGHNPATSAVGVAMILLTLGLAVTGLMMSSGGEVVEELHEVLAYTMIAVVGAHVVGVAWHVVRRRDDLVLGMIDGRKQGEPAQAIGSAHAVVGLVFLALTGAWAGALFKSYDPAARVATLPLLGRTIQLGESEDAKQQGRGGEHHHGRERHHDD